MPTKKLTQHSITKLRAPTTSGKQVAWWDETLSGFAVLCSGVSDTKSYIAQRDLPNGRTRRVTIGNVAELPLAEARERAKRLLLDMRSGIDPKHRSAATATLGDTLKAYLAAKKDFAALRAHSPLLLGRVD
jgi:hypothetical protein